MSQSPVQPAEPQQDESCLVLFAQGETEHAWDRFLLDYRKLLFFVAGQHVHDQEEIMDRFAFVLEKLRADDARRLCKYNPEHSSHARFSTYVVTLVQHLLIDRSRGRASVPPEGSSRELDLIPDEHEAEFVLPEGAAKDALERAMAALAPKTRHAIELFKMEGKPSPEVVATLGLSGPKALYNLVSRGEAEVRRQLRLAGFAREDFEP